MILSNKLRLEYYLKPKQLKKNHRLWFLKKYQTFTLLSGQTKWARNLMYLFNKRSLTFNLKHFQYINKQLKLNLKLSLLKLKKFYLRLYNFPEIYLTLKPKGIRMGRGKGVLGSCVKKIACGSFFLNIYYLTYLTCTWFFKKLKRGFPTSIYFIKCYYW